MAELRRDAARPGAREREAVLPRARRRRRRGRGEDPRAVRQRGDRGRRGRVARYLVTGATGFLGGVLARQLREAGHDVVALVRRSSAVLGALDVDQRPGDITDPASVRAAMAAVDGVFHCAAWYAVGRPDRAVAQRVNVGGTRNVLEAMRDLGVARGVYTSTVAVFGDTRGQVVDEDHRTDGTFPTVYDATKWKAHYEVAHPLIRAGLPLVIVQPGVIYGPGDHSPVRSVIDRYLLRRLPALTSAAYCWGHVEDTAQAHISAMERGRVGESYIVAGPPHSLAEALGIAEGITGIPAPRRQVPRALTDLFARIPGDAFESLRAMGATYLGSNAKARAELRFRPRSLADGFAEVLPAHLAELGAA